MRIIGIVIVTLFIIGFVMPIGFSNDSDLVALVYGETNQENSHYKKMVNEYFENTAHVDTKSSNNKVITANNLNDICGSFTNRLFTKDDIYLSSLVDLNNDDNLTVNVDELGVTSVSSEMIKSALLSAGITKGHVYITSPVVTTGDFALADVLYSYESVTNIEIPANIKKAAICEIYTQAEIVTHSNVSKENLTNLVSDVKGKVIDENISNHNDIVDLINKENNKTKLNLTNNDIEKLADAIGNVQSVQNDSNNLKNHILIFSDTHIKSDYSLNNVIDWINSL